MPLRLWLSALVLTAACLSAAVPAKACSCGGISPEEAIRSSDFVFYGTVVEIPSSFWEGPFIIRESNFFQVERQRKGNITGIVQMPIGSIGGFCDYAYEIGWSGVVFANGSPETKLRLDFCTMDSFPRDYSTIPEELLPKGFETDRHRDKRLEAVIAEDLVRAERALRQGEIRNAIEHLLNAEAVAPTHPEVVVLREEIEALSQFQ